MEKERWLSTTMCQMLFGLVDVITLHFVVLNSVLLENTYELLLRLEYEHSVVQKLQYYRKIIEYIFIDTQDNEQVARTSTSCLKHLALNNGWRLDCDQWNRWCRCVVECQQKTLPWKYPQQQYQQIEMMGGDEWTVPRNLLVKCLVQLNLVHCIQDTLFFPSHTNIENDQENPSLAQTGSTHTPQEDHQNPIMYNYFTTQ
ncbi:hypothetical protein Pmani_018866 [Petrolisthes manimaculis]|uniref:Uncharacterized protein n=1 Tax=Petrolisthes manimaculis TaxID=1843537 RepID=A0AAE1U8B6_9EUCA|nr:hypothetical protein Pmani_018866 [Petrolisthes manimaculis]